MDKAIGSPNTYTPDSGLSAEERCPDIWILPRNEAKTNMINIFRVYFVIHIPEYGQVNGR